MGLMPCEEGLEGGSSAGARVGEVMRLSPPRGFCLPPLFSPKCAVIDVTENLTLRC